MPRDRRVIRDAPFRVVGLVLLLLLLGVLSPAFAQFYTEYLWFDSLDLAQVFTRRISAAIALSATATLATAAFLLLNWSLLPHWIAPKDHFGGGFRFAPSRRGAPTQRTTVSTRPLRLVLAFGAVVTAVVVGLSFAQLWRVYLMAREGVPFNLEDPIFGLDVGFYVFQLPWYRLLLGRVQAIVALGLAGALVRYALFGQMRMRGGTAHLSLLGAIWLALVGVGRLLSRYALLHANDGIVFGAGYADVHARMPLYVIEAILFFAAGVVLVVNTFTRQWRLLVGIGLFWVGLSLVGPVYPALVQQFQVEPNEFALERPFIQHNIDLTRRAYQLHTITDRDYPAAGTLTSDDLEANAEVLSNLRLWDYRPLRRTYSQLQEIRLYYSFHDVDIDRYEIDGALTQVMLSARELDVDELADQAQTWVNRHLIFTHGYGLTLSSANRVTVEGFPELLVRDIPPVAEDPALALTQPGIYFGELTHDYALVNTAEDEFDYPQGDTNVYTRYTGSDGVRLGGPLQRLMFATRFGSGQILLSSALSADSRVLFHRLIHDRAATIAPMLLYDEDPYPIIVDGRLVWLLDAYTWSLGFPYSEPVETPEGSLNYLRNSVKVTVDAYTGETHYYMVDSEDPIIQTYARIFPGLFEPVTSMPESIRAHWRYPERLFAVQSERYATYHMSDPHVFYNREDLWDVPQELVETEQRAMEPYYVTMRLSDSDDLEFLLIRPYVPRQKQNMVAWLYARSDEEAYGELGVFTLAKDRLIYGPLQIEGRIDQDPIISQQLALWNQRGSHVLRGNLLVVPLNDTFLYVEPLYLEAESGQLPELARIIVSYADRVAMADTLDVALLQVLEGSVPEVGVPGIDETMEELAARAWEHYQAGQACLTAGDWTCYGLEQAQLESVLRLMADE